ncbi:prepilin-type N-terminal cleavage/methylation domain-containing protein [Myxococcus sp. K15C18031901]|uniref:type IV pilus modification PilV family protein n=1 Tax=Myxococcus dinghuensis TaxID=2906761 RepID=UPI0020A72688|nr:prepilin-type N-terminal cleavage/methylation domain-containing protein [Myxococcus dinghuensis]MCP3099036.1 prepilin-type N-terminal cleavage/methylation domain-containing protein [Myxococcus dinghuensis]
MKSVRSQAPRGVTLIEVLATMAVMLLGVAAVMTLVTQISYSNRRTLTQTQAQVLAERTLENIAAMGCSVQPPCNNLATLDNTRTTVWQTASGDVLTSAPPANVTARAYEIAVDVDSPVLLGSIEGGAVGSPAINRDLLPGVSGTVGNVANVRVSVSWKEPSRRGRQVVVMQTRVAP